MKVIEKILKAAKDQRISQRNLEQTAALPNFFTAAMSAGIAQSDMRKVCANNARVCAGAP